MMMINTDEYYFISQKAYQHTLIRPPLLGHELRHLVSHALPLDIAL